MALQASGAITLDDLATEFNGPADPALGDFYRGGSYVPDNAANSGIPTSGEIELADFYSASGVQNVTINGGVNVILTSDAGFTALDKNFPIAVTLTGNFTSTSTGTAAFRVGNVSTWDQVDIELDTGAIIYGKGGNGGAGEQAGGTGPNGGGSGGYALDINSANSSANLSFTNNGYIRGGGGGGGGGNRAGYADYNSDGKFCWVDNGTLYAPGGGGGGGAGQSVGSGGSGPGNASDGSSGTALGAGSYGTRGSVIYNNYNGSGNCSNSTGYGYHGRNGGASGLIGQSASNSASPGAAGYWVRNRNHCSWPSGYGLNVGSTHT